MEISIILPTYNEAQNIPLVTERIRKVLDEAKISHEIIVADDNSPDMTWQIAEKLRKKIPHLRVLRRMVNKGLSPAVMDGFRAAAGTYMVVMDADMQHDEKVLPEFVEKFRAGADIVVGTRKASGGSIEGWSRRRRFISWGATLLAKFFLPRSPSDPMSGYFGISRDLYHEIADKINPRGFKILLEILSHSCNKKLEEVGYTFSPRVHGESKLSGSVILQYLIGLYDIRFGKIIPLRFIKYGMVGASGVVVNQAGLYLGKAFLSMANENSLLMGIEVSIISNYFLNNYFTFADRHRKGFRGQFYGLFLFHLVSIAGAVINYAVAILFSEGFGMNIYIANLIGIALATVWNFMLNIQWTWKEK